MITRPVLKECYMKDMGYKFVAKKFGIQEWLVKRIYNEFDKEQLKDNTWFSANG